MTPRESSSARARHVPSAKALAEPTLRLSPKWLGAAALLLGALVWTYWPIAEMLFKEWQRDDNYSVGQLVPLAALYLLWRDRGLLRTAKVKPCWWGLAIILIAQGARAYGLLFVFESAERYSMLLTLYGLVLLIAGWDVFKRVFWILLFLLLMIPLPGKVHDLISGPLQTLATAGAAAMLETIGVTVVRQGNLLTLNDRDPLAVAEACSGLRMLTAFVVVAAALAYMVNRPRWQKTVLLLSSVPIAILCNLIRLLITAELYLVAGSETAETFFHDFAGLAMMPPAVLLLFGELWLMKKLVVPDGPGQEQVQSPQRQVAPAASDHPAQKTRERRK